MWYNLPMDYNFSLFSNNIAIDVLHKIVDFLPTLLYIGKNILGYLIGISFPLSLFFLIAIIYTVERLKIVRIKEEEKYNLAKVEPAFEKVAPGDMALAHRWENAQKHISSSNQNDWKQAVIDCDIILDDLLNKMGYRGDSVGEKLKRVAKGDMKSLDDAWEAHKVRNRIAHEPGFILDHHVAHKVIKHYQKVFEEFYYI